ncbi:MAG: histidine kinase dimerization/phospho-acceptor domain-containing protein [Bacteriovorax sp.]|nr:histidine kinase dimerization/phospho-acceptor domain-containing protein [Bacteriovorax sp.]
MKNKLKTKLNFIVDSKLVQEDRAEILLRALQDEKIKYMIESKDSKEEEHNLSIIFTHKTNLRFFSKYKNRIHVLDSNEDHESGQVEKINLNSYEEITLFLEKLFILEKRTALQIRTRESERLYDKIKILNNQLTSAGLINLSSDQQKDLESLLDLEILLLREEQISNWNTHFKAFAKKHGQLQNMGLFCSAELLKEENVFDESTLIFNLPFNDLFLTLKFKSIEESEQAQCIELVITMILRTIQIQDQQLIKSDGEIDFWKKIFSKIPYPMAVISNLGDLLIYNESFAKIGILPKECLRFKDQESLEIYQQFYKVRRIEFPINLSDVSYFIFYTIESRDANNDLKTNPTNDSRKGTQKGTVDELGIVSSSIAHELNNPLAGILAALSLLSLEDDWSEDALIDLDDMKNGAKRCKELVEIFLGFSKFSPSAAQAPSIKDSLDQALNLLRFRMVESNLRLEMKYTPTLEVFSHQINSSIMSMILYLILNELMTAFAHERLITQTHINSMSGEVLEFSNQIVMKLDYDFEYEEKLAQSKLIQHLLAFEKLEINFLRKEIRLIYRS